MIKNKRIKELNLIALPLIIQSISSLIIGLSDQAMVGRISSTAFSAVGVVVSMMSTLVGIIGSLSVVFNIRGSNFLGRNDRDNINDEFMTSILLNFLIGFIFFLLIIVLKKPILILFFRFSDEILKEGILYFTILSVYPMIQLLLFIFNSYFKIIKKTKWILLGSFIASISNLVLDYILIFGKLGFKRMGIQGAALGSIIAILIQLMIYIIICRKDLQLGIIRKRKLLFHKALAQIKESIPFMGQEILDGSIFLLLIHAILSRIGILELTSYLILVQLINIIQMPMYMYGSATLTLVSQGKGGENKNDIIEYPVNAVKLSSFLYVILGFVFFILKDITPRIITDDLEIIKYTSMLFIFIFIAHLFEPISTIYRYSLQAVGESNYVLKATAIVNGIIILLMLFFYTIMENGIYGIFISLFINYILLYIVYKRKYKKETISI